ncbi:MAG TPA: phosphatidylserine/phosphatidylglycerophosphate/cardiolipin synthase family protein [Candidatus Paceibacterota bacterium]|nr:phosphatidylserine/phosphatidylglycerophosphate/cardiolipin synthase family protein [Candidatus Paceibacterota bacterium]
MSSVTRWELLASTEEAWQRVLAAAEASTRSIAIEQYILGDSGPFVDTLFEVLRRKAREGVRVRLLIDAVGSFLFYQSSLPGALRESGIELVFHRTLLPPSWRRILPSLLRDHRKLWIFDDREAFVGGVIFEDRARDWRDTTVVLAGGIVADAARLFETAWQKTGRGRPVGPMRSEESGEFYFLGNSFRLRDKHLYRLLIRKIAEANTSVDITTPYFALTHQMRRALRYALGKGVRVRLLAPDKSDNRLADILTNYHLRWCGRHGIQVFRYTASILHAKTVAIDGNWATVGSCNFDWLSFFFNYELNIVSENAEFSAKLREQFEKDLATNSASR